MSDRERRDNSRRRDRRSHDRYAQRSKSHRPQESGFLWTRRGESGNDRSSGNRSKNGKNHRNFPFPWMQPRPPLLPTPAMQPFLFSPVPIPPPPPAPLNVFRDLRTSISSEENPLIDPNLSATIDTVKKKLHEKRADENFSDDCPTEGPFWDDPPVSAEPSVRTSEKRRIEHSPKLSKAKKPTKTISRSPKSDGSAPGEKADREIECQAWRKKILKQLFGLKTDKLRSLIDNPEFLKKYNPMLDNYLKEVRKQISDRLRDAAEKSLPYREANAADGDRPMTIRDDFMGRLGEMLDTDTCIELENMKPQLIEALGDILREDLLVSNGDVAIQNISDVIKIECPDDSEVDPSIKLEPVKLEDVHFDDIEELIFSNDRRSEAMFKSENIDLNLPSGPLPDLSNLDLKDLETRRSISEDLRPESRLVIAEDPRPESHQSISTVGNAESSIQTLSCHTQTDDCVEFICAKCSNRTDSDDDCENILEKQKKIDEQIHALVRKKFELYEAFEKKNAISKNSKSCKKKNSKPRRIAKPREEIPLKPCRIVLERLPMSLISMSDMPNFKKEIIFPTEESKESEKSEEETTFPEPDQADELIDSDHSGTSKKSSHREEKEEHKTLNKKPDSIVVKMADLPCIIHEITAIEFTKNRIILGTSVGLIYIYCFDGESMTEIQASEMPIRCVMLKSWKNYHLQAYVGSLDCTLKCFNVKENNKVFEDIHIRSSIECMHEDWGSLFLGLTNGEIMKFNIKNKKMDDEVLNASDNRIFAIQSSREGPRKVLIVGSLRERVIICDAHSGLLLRIFEQSGSESYKLIYNEDKIFCASGGHIDIFDFWTSDLMHSVKGGKIVYMTILKAHLITVSDVGSLQMYRIYFDKSKVIYSHEFGKNVNQVSIHNNKMAVSFQDQSLSIWNLSDLFKKMES